MVYTKPVASLQKHRVAGRTYWRSSNRAVSKAVRAPCRCCISAAPMSY